MIIRKKIKVKALHMETKTRLPKRGQGAKGA